MPQSEIYNLKSEIYNFRSVFEQIIKRLARRIGLCRRSGRSLLFDSDADGIKGALVLRIFLCDPLRHWLHALESARRIEIRALLAGVQFEAAFRTLTKGFRERGQQSSALGAARYRMGAWHLHRPRAVGIVFASRTLR